MSFCFRTPKWEPKIFKIGTLAILKAFKFQEFFNDIRNSSIQWILTPTITLWKFMTPTPKVGAHSRVWRFIPSHFFTFLRTWNVTIGLHIWPAPLQALALVTSPRVGLQQFVDHFLLSRFTTISLNCHIEDEKGHLVWTQKNCIHLWRKYGRHKWIPKIVGTPNQAREG